MLPQTAAAVIAGVVLRVCHSPRPIRYGRPERQVVALKEC